MCLQDNNQHVCYWNRLCTAHWMCGLELYKAVGFCVSMALSNEDNAFWGVTTCNMLELHRPFAQTLTHSFSSYSRLLLLHVVVIPKNYSPF